VIGRRVGDVVNTIDDKALNGALAARFNRELFDSVETLGDLAHQHGVRTLVDLMYMQDAVLRNGFIDAWPESSVLRVLEALPSARRWLGYVNVYDEANELVQRAVRVEDDVEATGATATSSSADEDEPAP